MKEERLHEFTNLIDLGGGWAARALFDDAVSRKIDGLPQDKTLANMVAAKASGRAAGRYLNKYQRLTGIRIHRTPPSEYSSMQSILNLDEVAARFPVGRLTEFWIECLCEHLVVTRKDMAGSVERVLSADERPKGSPHSMIQKWSWPFIRSVLPFQENKTELECREDNIAQLCWRRWYTCLDGRAILLIGPNADGLGASQWLVWRLLHDATHLLHLASRPTRSLLDPKWLLTMEAAAMAVELAFLEAVAEESEPSPPVGYPYNRHRVKTVILLGLVERSLRLDFDIRVHGDGECVTGWIDSARKQTGLHSNFFDFAEEFHGLPGFCAGYMAGLDAIRAEREKDSVLAGASPLRIPRTAEEDMWSRAPETDVPEQKSKLQIPVHSVGANQATCRFKLKNPFSSTLETVVADAIVSVNLDANRRGIHMSRIQEVLVGLDNDRQWSSLTEVTNYVAKRVKLLQGSQHGYAHMRTQTIAVSKNQISQSVSQKPIVLSASSSIEDNKEENQIGIALKVMTACPCTLAYSQLRAKANLEAHVGPVSLFVLNSMPPTFTHSQSGTLELKVTSIEVPPSADVLYSAILSVAHIVESVLKRPDEHHFIEQVHKTPQFCEDLCRQVAFAVSSSLQENDVVEVFVEMDESIHPHRVFANAKLIARDLWLTFNEKKKNNDEQ